MHQMISCMWALHTKHNKSTLREKQGDCRSEETAEAYFQMHLMATEFALNPHEDLDYIT